MIKRLRNKFIVINMALVSTVLIAVFIALMVTTYRQANRTLTNAMYGALHPKQESSSGNAQLPEIGEPPENMNTPKNRIRPSEWVPLVTVVVSEEGLVQVEKTLATMADETLSAAVDAVLASEENNGYLSQYNLRYVAKTLDNGSTRIVFADRSFETESLQNLLLPSLIIGLISLGAFFFISCLLSRVALKPVEKAWEQQRQFVADASHELKTPLTVILANTGILLRHPDDTIMQQQKWVESTKAEGERMKELIDHMLFLAKTDADQMPLSFSPLDLSDTLWSCLLPFESVAFEQGITLDPQVEADITVNGDAAQLKQLIMILLDNACKYAARCSTISVSLIRSQETAEAVLSVHNQGEAIPAEDLPHIFERFYRVDASRSRSAGGYGLGLAIAKTIADRHKASLHVNSSAPEGTTFILRLPLKDN